MRRAERLVDLAHLGRRQGQPARGLERAAVQDGGIGVRVALAGVLGGRAGVAPGAHVIAGAQEVQREDVGALVGADAELALDELARARVQRPAALERQRLVGRVALEHVAEAHAPGSTSRKSPSRARAAREVVGRAGRACPSATAAGSCGRARRRAAARRRSAGMSVSRRVASSASIVVGSASSSAPARAAATSSRRNSGLPWERSTSARRHVRRQRLAAVGDDEPARRVVAERRQLDALVGVHERLGAALVRPARDDDRPPALAGAAQDGLQQVAGRLVEPVRVLDDEQRPARGQQRRQQPVDEEVQLRAAELAGQARRRAPSPASSSPNGIATSASCAVASGMCSASVRASAAASASSDAGSGAIRRRSGARSARYGVERPYAPDSTTTVRRPAAGDRVGDQLGHEARLADAGLADELHDPPGALARAARRRRAGRASSGSRPTSGRSATSRDAARARLADERGADRDALALDRERGDGRQREGRRGRIRAPRRWRAPGRRARCP